MLGAAFAGPLLRVLGMQSFGINLYGKTKVGKSTAQIVGGSIIGLGNERALPSFKATIVGLDQIAITCNDIVLFINEAGLLGRDAYNKISPMIYGFSEGKDKTRADVSMYASDVAASGWSLVYVLSSEHAVEALAMRDGTTRQGGEEPRCLDVPAVHSGNATIFDHRPPGLTDEGFTRWAHRQMAKIREACEANHGVVFDAYLRGLIDLGDKLKDRARYYVDEFVASLFLKDVDGAVNHAARNFGAIYAGICLAIDMGLLPSPWRKRAARKAVKGCFRDGLKVSRLRDTVLEEAKAILHQRLSDTPSRGSRTPIPRRMPASGWPKVRMRWWRSAPPSLSAGLAPNGSSPRCPCVAQRARRAGEDGRGEVPRGPGLRVGGDDATLVQCQGEVHRVHGADLEVRLVAGPQLQGAGRTSKASAASRPADARTLTRW